MWASGPRPSPINIPHNQRIFIDPQAFNLKNPRHETLAWSYRNKTTMTQLQQYKHQYSYVTRKKPTARCPSRTQVQPVKTRQQVRKERKEKKSNLNKQTVHRNQHYTIPLQRLPQLATKKPKKEELLSQSSRSSTPENSSLPLPSQ